VSGLEEAALRATALRVLYDFTKARYFESRAEMAEVMPRGLRVPGRSPLDDSKVGAVTMSDPAPVAAIADQAAFNAWVAETYPEHIETVDEIAGSNREVVAVLAKHAPHLLRHVTVVNPDFVSQVKTVAVDARQPAGPGGEADVPGLSITVPDPVVTCRLAPGALESVMALIRTGQLSLESLAQPAIENHAA
jgi:hypothetical protein